MRYNEGNMNVTTLVLLQVLYIRVQTAVDHLRRRDPSSTGPGRPSAVGIIDRSIDRSTIEEV